LLATLSACGTSQDETFDPLAILAQFAVVQATTQSAEGSNTEAFAGVIFWQGVFTKTVPGGSVEVVDPEGVPHAMRIVRTASGDYYKADLSPQQFQFGARYTFRVRLEDGTAIPVESAPTPSQDFVITEPVAGQRIQRGQGQQLDVSWSNRGDGNVVIAIRRNPADIFSIIGLGHPRNDVGAARIPVGDPAPGRAYLEITRKGLDAAAGGFGGGSTVYASLCNAVEVVIE